MAGTIDTANGSTFGTGTGLSDGQHLRLAGRAEVFGSSGPFELRTDRRGRLCYRAGAELSEAGGWDGSRAWLAAVSGVPRTLHHHERDLALLPWWGLCGFLGCAERPGSWVAEGAETGDAGYRLELDGLSARVAFTARGATSALSAVSCAAEETTRYGDWIEVAGRKVARRMVTEVAGVELRKVEVEEVEVVAGGFECPRPASTPARFGRKAPREVEVERAPTGHFLVRPRIGGREIGAFILDTGGGPGVIATSRVAELGLEPIGRGVVTSFEGSGPGDVYRLPETALGPVRLGETPVVGMDLGFLAEPLGTEIAGILGFGLLSRVVAEIAPATSTLRLFPADHDPPGATPWHPLELVDLVPVARGRFPGGEGLFRLDLGAGGEAGGVVFHSPAARALGLAETLPGAAALPEEPAIAGRLDFFEIAGHRLKEVPTLLWTSEQGALADPYLTGNVGLTLLEAFTLVLDYPRERFRLVPLDTRPQVI